MTAVETMAQARGATRRFGAFTAVRGVDVIIGRGEVVGLLGGNGAGKTTLIRLLLGLLRPSEGSVRLFGSAPSLRTRRRVGYVPQTLGLYAGLTVRENWTFAAAAYHAGAMPLPDAFAARAGDLVGQLPLGEQRQVAFAVALSHRPELLILDEPTSGTGPLSSARLWDEIRQAASQGAGVLVTTHNLEEAGQCDRLVVMSAGQVVAAGSAAQITGGRTVAEIRCDDPGRAFRVLDHGSLPVQAHGKTLRVGGATAQTLTRMLSGAGIDAAVRMVPANLEEAFVAIVADPGVA